MRTLSTAAWVAHNLGLAACFGGLLFGKTALNPSLNTITSEAERGKMLNTTWNRYNAINVGLVCHGGCHLVPRTPRALGQGDRQPDPQPRAGQGRFVLRWGIDGSGQRDPGTRP